MNILQALVDCSALVKEVVDSYKNPNDPTEKSDVVTAMSKCLVDFGVKPADSQTIGGLFADAVETAGGADSAPGDIMADLQHELANHKVVLPAIAQTFLLIVIQQVTTLLHSWLQKK